MRIAVTGAGGRLGRAAAAALAAAPFTGPGGPIPWHRTDFDLDDPADVGRLLDRDRVELVVHAAAWTDVDGCARDPALAMRRNGVATTALAAAAAARGIDLILISTNEVFDGTRSDRAYLPNDPPAPANPYGASKLAGERGAMEVFARGTAGGSLGIARTAWLFGPGAPDFPNKIARAARRAALAGEPLAVVGDEIGTPTYVADLGQAIADIVESGDISGIRHLVNGGRASRAAWARDVVARLGIEAGIRDVAQATFSRASSPPLWGVLEPTALPDGRVLRTWPDAMADYAPILRRSVKMRE